METVTEDDAMTKQTTANNHSLNVHETEKQVAELKAIIFDTPISNDTKIQFIKEELATGRYAIHSEHIADKLLEQHVIPEPVEYALD